MKKAEILPNMTAIWLRNQTTEFLLGTDRRNFALSILVEAEIPRGEGFRKFQPETKILRSFSIDVVPYYAKYINSIHIAQMTEWNLLIG